MTQKPKRHQIIRDSHPQLIEAYEQYCLLNHIHEPPELWQTNDPFCSAQALENNIILLGPEFMNPQKYSLSQQLAIIAHEMAHFHEPQRLANYKKPAQTSLKKEQDADKFAVQTLGKHAPLSTAIERYCIERDEMLDAMRKVPNKQLQRIAKNKQRSVKTSEGIYGTLEQRLALIEELAGSDDRSFAEKLIEQRNQAISQTRTS